LLDVGIQVGFPLPIDPVPHASEAQGFSKTKMEKKALGAFLRIRLFLFALQGIRPEF
jgi:hypothetical protein